MIGTLTGKGAAADELLVIMLCHVIIMSHHHDMAWLCVNCYGYVLWLHVMRILSFLECINDLEHSLQINGFSPECVL